MGMWKQRSMYYSVWLYQEKIINKEKEKELKMKREAKTNFIEETLKDGFDVNKILGNYVERAKKSWTKKSHDYTQDDLAKVVVKLRTIIKITHHNLELLDKNLVAGCRKSFPGIQLEQLAASAIPEENGGHVEENGNESNAVNNVKIKKEKGKSKHSKENSKGKDSEQVLVNGEDISKTSSSKDGKIQKTEKITKKDEAEEENDDVSAAAADEVP